MKMKTKIKTKNEFQNPNLIFGNEIQKKTKIEIEKQNLKINNGLCGVYSLNYGFHA